MLLSLIYLTLLVNLPLSSTNPVSLSAIRHWSTLHLPLIRREVVSSTPRRVLKQGAIGLGDYIDVTYDVLVQVGETLAPLVLDTGSSDLWVLSSSCSTDCFSVSVPLYPQTSFQPSGVVVRLEYGDSLTGTFAQGPVGMDIAGVSGLRIQNQYFAAISETNTSVLQTGSAGIFGLGFPVNSIIWNKLLTSGVSRDSSPNVRRSHSLGPRVFPDLSGIRKHPTMHSDKGRSLSPNMNDVLASFATNGPLLPRLILAGALASPIVSISLQRDAIDVGGSQGVLSIGELPADIAAEDLTWVPLRCYTSAEGGLPAPEEFPNEVYPITWEVAIDDVYFDGRKLSRSALAASNPTLTALLDTTFWMQSLRSSGGDTYNCAEAHTLTFQIGGSFYPVDPRDFGSQTFEDTTSRCTPNLAPRDPPSSGFLYSWSIGDPFLKSVFVAFYYGNLTHPSQDPPRVGLRSNVPSDAAQRLQAAVQLANASFGGNLPLTSEAAPHGTPPSAGTTTAGVPQTLPSPSSQISYGPHVATKPFSFPPISIIGLLAIVL
ncbi:aspartic peptidase domain-containing protein [Russula earlei]|uniref:Aspartic peptidase domain-containing protein n=1 Tax=Russula earlei TaxID=71964 RepID=A0ACC0U103_9AGAM|nr:aspartic peptidase domain-containing protein [Russula earlei]